MPNVLSIVDHYQELLRLKTYAVSVEDFGTGNNGALGIGHWAFVISPSSPSSSSSPNPHDRGKLLLNYWDC
ncbi:MAG: hypothetical protein RMY34_10455 [Aulosira sp. DedQUE10]|nr:hypothetical protein [Aulosira sp. DedQUE10]